MTPWLDCAHCRSLPDGGAGNRPTTLSLIHQPVEDLSNSRRAHGTARVPGCLRPPHERLTQPTTGPLLVPSTRSRPARSRLHPRQVPFQRHHHSVRWIRAKTQRTNPRCARTFCAFHSRFGWLWMRTCKSVSSVKIVASISPFSRSRFKNAISASLSGSN